MKTYLVGGAVRDRLLGFPSSERDWVVVGGSADLLLAQGYRSVGKDFPVFLHPESREEYALARRERKVAKGYGGFEFSTDVGVSLEEDLQRRDLTINAMALDENDSVIDPYGGQSDLEERWLRHVSSAFCEDPVRILRVARFMARFLPLGFRIAPETMALMREMVATGEVDALVPERVFKELARALCEPEPQAFFETLQRCGALERLFPELNDLFGVPQSADHPAEADVGVHALRVLIIASRLSQNPSVRFAALVHDLGKGKTNPSRWPRHPQHNIQGISLLRSLCLRLRVPLAFQRLAERVIRFHDVSHRALELSCGATVDLLQRLDAIRQPELFEAFLLAASADARGRVGFEDLPYPQADWLREAREAVVKTPLNTVFEAQLKGQELTKAIREARIQSVNLARMKFNAT
jgi:tRNA nucleotidyltransferase (CCA-adding enzyme)